MSDNASSASAASSSSSSPSRPADINSTDGDVLMDKGDNKLVQLQPKSKSKKLSGKFRRHEADEEEQVIQVAAATEQIPFVSDVPRARKKLKITSKKPKTTTAVAVSSSIPVANSRSQRHAANASATTLRLRTITSQQDGFTGSNRVPATEEATAIIQKDAVRVAAGQASEIDLLAPCSIHLGEVGFAWRSSFLLLQMLGQGSFLSLCEQTSDESTQVAPIVANVIPHLSLLVRQQFSGPGEKLKEARRLVLDVLVSKRKMNAPRSEWRLHILHAILQAGADPNEERCQELLDWDVSYQKTYHSFLLIWARCDYPDAQGLIYLLEAGAQPSTTPVSLLEVLVRRQAVNSLHHLAREAAPKLASLDFSKALQMSQDQVQSANGIVEHTAAMATQAALIALQGECVSWLNMAERLVDQVAPFPDMASIATDFLRLVPAIARAVPVSAH